tara:strand:+ start:56 stop:268 length:213 start_codon:yes stop_codon:yes gene_type:complete
MKVGDLVWVRFTVISTAPKLLLDRRRSFKLGIIIDDKHGDSGLYKIYVAEYNTIDKYFIADLSPVEALAP